MQKRKALKAIPITAGVLSAIIIVLVVTAYCGGVFPFVHPLYDMEEGKIKVACVGDSITYGFLVFDWQTKNYPCQLGKQLGDKFTVNNYGYSGRTARPDGDTPYVEVDMYKKSLEFEPNIVVFMLGTNDTRNVNWKGKEKFKNDYVDLLNNYIELASKPEIILMAPPPVWEFLGKVRYNLQNDRIKNEINQTVREVAEEKSLIFIDLYAVFEDKQNMFIDGVHPTAEGAWVIAETVFKTIEARSSVYANAFN